MLLKDLDHEVRIGYLSDVCRFCPRHGLSMLVAPPISFFFLMLQQLFASKDMAAHTVHCTSVLRT